MYKWYIGLESRVYLNYCVQMLAKAEGWRHHYIDNRVSRLDKTSTSCLQLEVSPEDAKVEIQLPLTGNWKTLLRVQSG